MSLTQALQQFIGTENYYFLPQFPSFRYTDGVKYLAEKAGAYWLIEAIFSHNRREHFQYWKLNLNAADRGAILTM